MLVLNKVITVLKFVFEC